ncbi:MAG TPA: serine/threonine-protein kinase [Bryobacteraceae bacterium]|nr:serine/threonine-protein kinase [Bryobacteraceae bacterium]
MNPDKLCMGCMENDSGEPVCPKCGSPFNLTSLNSLQLPPRTLLHDQYLLGRALGHGGFGVTYLAWDIGLATRLAVKEFMPNGVAGRGGGMTEVIAYSDHTRAEFEWGLERFLEEARTLKKFKNFPGIVSIDTAFRDNGTAYLVMEYLDGSTLEDFLKKRGGKIPIETALEIMLPVMRALSAVHAEGILHRDISPDNIYVTQSGKVKLIDFGAARNALGQKSRNLSIILKEGFAPEEQYRASGVQGPWTDVYATAGTLYHALTGRVPQSALDRQVEDKVARPSALGVAIDPGTENALMKALAVKATERFQSMEDFKAALTGTADITPAPSAPVQRHDAQPYAAPPPATFVPPPAPAKSSSPKWLWPGVGGIVALIGLIAFLARPTPAPTPTPGPGPAKPAESSSEYKTMIQQALELDKKHSYPDELALLDKAIKLDPNGWEAYDLEAQVYLYNMKRFPEARKNFEASLARGGNATFHVAHDHGGGNFTTHCNGWLYVTRTGVEFKSWDSIHKFKVTRSQMSDLRSMRAGAKKGPAVDRHGFLIKVGNQTYDLAPLGQFADDQRSMILGILGGN